MGKTPTPRLRGMDPTENDQGLKSSNVQNYTVTKNQVYNNGTLQDPSEFFKNDFFNNDFFKNAMSGQFNEQMMAIPTGKNKSVTTTVTNGKNGKTVTNVVQVYHNIQNNNIHNNITNNITINISLKGLFTDEEIYEFMRQQEEREKREEDFKKMMENKRYSSRVYYNHHEDDGMGTQ